MKKTLKFLAIILALSLAYSCGEKEPQPQDPPQQEQPDDPVNPDPENREDPENPGEPGDEQDPADPNNYQVRTAQDLVNLATLVNEGTEVKSAMLMNDIDMASVTEWVPIGNAVCPAGAADAAITGNAWTGVFDGNGYKIKNLKMVANTSTAGANYGLFGVLAPGSLVQNFVIDSSCSFEVTATASVATGVVAGYVFDATVRDITSHAPMTFKGKAGSVFMSMALIGQVYCKENGITIDSCHNTGEINAENTDNLEAGAKAYHIAGIVGFAHALSGAPVMTTVSDCSNSGYMTSATGRTAGIVGAMNRNIQLVNCENSGNQLNTMPKEDGSRLGNITCNITAGCKMTGCVNKGNLVSTTKGRCGGITSLSNTAVFENCANYGEVLTDGTYRGLFWGYNTAEATWKNCTASGKVGKYNGGTPVYDEYTEATKAQYLGVQKAGTASALIDINYQIGVKPPEASDVEAELSILFIGNSFTKDAVEHLPGILKAAGLEKVHMVHMYYGGRLVSEYNAGWTTSSDYHKYECLPGSTEWAHTTNTNLAEIAASKKWDIVTIQEHTGNAAAWTWNATAKSNLQGLVDKVKAAQGTNVPKFHYILSQAYFNMAKIGSGSKPSMTWSDQAGMWNVIATFGQSVMNEVTFDGIISTGVMLQNLRTSNLDNEMNLTRDGYHMDNGISRYGASCTVFESLITPKFSVTMDGNTYRFATSDTGESSYTTPVTDVNAPVALQAARYAIQSPYTVTDMSNYQENVPGNSIGDVEYKEGSKE
jgi:hypothetical protein